MLRALLTLLVLASTGMLAERASAQGPGGQLLQFNDNGDSFATFGPNTEVRIHLGTLSLVTNCAPGGVNDFIFPTADIYLVPAGSNLAVGTELEDVSGQPNVVIATSVLSGSVFISELIGITAPGGTLQPGRYAVVYDECQNGIVDSVDAIFDPAVEVLAPAAGVPALPDASFQAVKAEADASRREWEETRWAYEAVFALASHAKSVAALWVCLPHAFPSVFLNPISDKISLSCSSGSGGPHGKWDARGGHFAQGLTQGVQWATGVNPKKSAIEYIVNKSRHYKGIHADPPDPDFRRLSPLIARERVDAASTQADEVALAEAGSAASRDGALLEALLRSLERYQGADAAGNAEWALVHARAARHYAALLDATLPLTAATVGFMRDVLAAPGPDYDAVGADLRQTQTRLRTEGPTDAERQAARDMGLTDAQVGEMLAHFDTLDLTYSRAGTLAGLTALAAQTADFRASLLAFAGDLDDLIAGLEDDPLVPDPHPQVGAGGPYSAAEGTPVGFQASGPAGASYAWDLDGDGAFDDATGASPSHAFTSPQITLAGVHVTDAAGVEGIAYAPVTVTNVNRGPSLEDLRPTAAMPNVKLGTTETFRLDTSDADGDAVTVSWFLDGAPAGQGTTLAWTPAAVGIHRIEAVADDASPLGDPLRWTWIAAAVAPAPPVPAFYPVPDGGGHVVSLPEAGATVHSSSGSIGGHTPQTMLDFSSVNLPWATIPGQGPNAWAKLQLAGGAPQAISGVQVQPRRDFPEQRVRQFAIDVSATTADDAAFTTVLTATTADNAKLQAFAFAEPVPARYVRYRPLSNHGGGGTCSGCISTQALRVISPQHGGRTVRFENRSTAGDSAIESYHWDFGDGTTSTEPSPTHTFPAASASYPVRLSVTDAAGQVRDAVLTQKVLTPPAAAFAVTTADPREGQNLNFTDQSVPAPLRTIAGRNWDWGDGTASGGASHVYADDADFTVELEVLDSAGEVSVVRSSVPIGNAAPVVAVGSDIGWVGGKVARTPVPVGPVNVTDPGSADTLSCRWDFGDGATSNACAFEHAYEHSAPWGTDAAPRVVDATLTVTDDDGATGSDSVRFTVRPAPIASPDNLVRNGDFESPDVGAAAWTVKGPGGNLPSWTIAPGSIDHINIYFGDSASGGQSIDVNGSGEGALYQDIATVPGETYRLRYAMAGNIESGPAIKRMRVLWDGAELDTPTFDITGRTRRSMGWTYHEYAVVATGAVTRLRFETMVEGVFGPFVDDVSLFPAPTAHPTATTLDCSPATITLGAASTCTATVSDTAVTPSTPAGDVAFTNGATCTLAGLGSTASCAVVFTPATAGANPISAGYAGGASHAGSTASASVTATAVNRPPVADDDALETDEDVSLAVAATTLAADDTDPDGDAVHVTAVSDAEHGTVQLAGGTVTFAPDGDFNGSAGFRYTIADPSGATATAAVRVDVRPVNDAPRAFDDARTGSQATPLSLAAAALVANDTDADGDALTVSAVSDPVNGTVALDAGTITFTPAAGFSGEARFTYRVSDGHGGSATATVRIALAPAMSDTLPPTCVITAQGKDATGRAFIRFEVRDAGSGLSRHQTIYLANATLSITPYSAGAPGPVIVTATAKDKTKSLGATVDFWDVAGNRATCDPIVISVARVDEQYQDETFTGVPTAESRVSIYNGDPGIRKVRLTVNGVKFKETDLQAGEVRKFDVASAMRPGNDNTITLRVRGKKGSSALIVIADIP